MTRKKDTRLVCLKLQDKHGNRQEDGPGAEIKKRQQFLRLKNKETCDFQILHISGESDALKSKLLESEDQKCIDFPWWERIKDEYCSPQSGRGEAQIVLESLRPKRLTWDDVEMLARREKCGIVEYDLFDSSGGATRALSGRLFPSATVGRIPP